jgi:hypothetical protein
MLRFGEYRPLLQGVRDRATSQYQKKRLTTDPSRALNVSRLTPMTAAPLLLKRLSGEIPKNGEWVFLIFHRLEKQRPGAPDQDYKGLVCDAESRKIAGG